MVASRQERFEALLHEHRNVVYKICGSYCRDRDDRDDLAQEIAVQLWRSFATFDGRSTFATWMYRVALNVAISFQRREIRRRRDLGFGDECLLQVPEPARDEPEDIRCLYEFIEGLPALDKALTLLYLDEHRYREISEIVGITETNVATKLGRLKQRMKAHFAARGAATQ
ncbi:MAG: sigma-70 family RNA polymerase sigma factor [Candidatus Tumulicola sp.]